MPFPQSFLDELMARSDIVDVVGSYVQLKRKGRLYGGLCPFHSEKTPSFYVYPATQSFYCFGCQAAGDAISFVKRSTISAAAKPSRCWLPAPGCRNRRRTIRPDACAAGCFP